MDTVSRSAMAELVTLEDTNEDGTVEKQPPLQAKSVKRKADAIEDEKENDDSEDTPTEVTAKRQKIPQAAELIFTAPVLWTAEAGTDARALHVNSTRCYVGTQDGRVIVLDHEGQTRDQFHLGSPVGAVFEDSGRLYAWCHSKLSYDKWKGALFDLTLSPPLALFDLRNFGDQMIHAAMFDGCLVVGDNNGNIAMLGCDGDIIWQRSQAEGDGGLFEVDEKAIYTAHKKCVRRYDPQTGNIVWEHEVLSHRFGGIQGGCQDADHVYVAVGGRVQQLSKASGAVQREYTPNRHRAAGVCVGNGLLVTGTCPTVIFNLDNTEEMFRMNFPGKLVESALQMTPEGKLFSAWDRVYCVNLSPDGITRASEGRSTRTFELTVPTTQGPPQHGGWSPPLTTEQAEGVIVQCRRVDDRIRTSVISSDYEENWNVQFPVDLCVPDKKYIITQLQKSSTGSFYRIAGMIYTLQEDKSKDAAATTDSALCDAEISHASDVVATGDETDEVNVDVK